MTQVHIILMTVHIQTKVKQIKDKYRTKGVSLSVPRLNLVTYNFLVFLCVSGKNLPNTLTSCLGDEICLFRGNASVPQCSRLMLVRSSVLKLKL